jgi:ferrous iron transport protein A
MSAKDLKKGNVCRVIGMNMSHHAGKQLAEMGIVPNCEIIVENVAPMGDPFLLRVRGYKLAVRKRDLEALDVKVTRVLET